MFKETVLIKCWQKTADYEKLRKVKLFWFQEAMRQRWAEIHGFYSKILPCSSTELQVLRPFAQIYSVQIFYRAGLHQGKKYIGISWGES